jgi:hypothetical protein
MLTECKQPFKDKYDFLKNAKGEQAIRLNWPKVAQKSENIKNVNDMKTLKV